MNVTSWRRWWAVSRVYHPYPSWEDHQAGMYAMRWVRPAVDSSILLLSNPTKLRAAMRKAVKEWPVSTEHNLTALEVNRRSWLGQAACCVAHGAPQGATCAAWWILDEEQRAAANTAADVVIGEWQEVYFRAETLFGD